MAILVDKLLNAQAKIGRIWYVSKPTKKPFINRVKDVWGILTGRFEAVKFAESEKDKDPSWKRETRILSELDVEKIKEKVHVDIVRKEYGVNVDDEGHPIVKRGHPCPCNSGKKYKNCHGKGRKNG